MPAADLLGSASTANGSSKGSAPPPRFPLRAGKWAAAAADLSQPGWLGKLEACGWDAAAPTVWVAEGLSYFLSQEDLDRLVKVRSWGLAKESSVLSGGALFLQRELRW
jgi:hypothetical protein